MNAICILWILLHTVDTSPGILRTPLHCECNMHTMDTSRYCRHLSMHTMDTFPLWMQYAYYGHLSILRTPLHYECNMHTMDTSPYCGHLSIMNAIYILWTPPYCRHLSMHTMDTFQLGMQYAYYGHLSMHTMDTFPLWMQYAYYGYLSILQTPFHYERNVHAMDTSSYCGHLSIMNTIGQLHDDDIWLQLPEFISLLPCYLNLSIPLRITEQ